MNHPRSVISDVLAVVSASSSIAAWQEQLDWMLKIIASLLAISAGIYSIISRRKSRNKSSNL
jgi:ABC-type nickel/cobalt efflux system permease component RcnA